MLPSKIKLPRPLHALDCSRAVHITFSTCRQPFRRTSRQGPPLWDTTCFCARRAKTMAKTFQVQNRGHILKCFLMDFRIHDITIFKCRKSRFSIPIISGQVPKWGAHNQAQDAQLFRTLLHRTGPAPDTFCGNPILISIYYNGIQNTIYSL